MAKYSIKEMSHEFGVPASTLRYYEKVGLLTGVRRDSNGQREYNDEHRDRLAGILCFKVGGLPISKICEFYRYDGDLANHIDDIVTLVEDHEANLKASIAELQKELVHIHQKVEFYNGIKSAISKRQKWPKYEDFAPVK